MTGAEHVSLLRYPVDLRDRLILLDGWSKTYAMTGWRMGYAVWPRRCSPQAERLAINCHSCVNAAAQCAGHRRAERPAGRAGPADGRRPSTSGGIRRRGAEQAARRLLRRSGRRLLRLPQHHRAPASTRASSSRLELLEEAGVATIAGTSFGAYGEGYLRFSYANSIENIGEAIERIGEWLGICRNAA